MLIWVNTGTLPKSRHVETPCLHNRSSSTCLSFQCGEAEAGNQEFEASLECIASLKGVGGGGATGLHIYTQKVFFSAFYCLGCKK